MKKLINKPEDAVIDALHGMQAAHSDLLTIHYEPHYIMRKDAPCSNKVALISGGGSGHEPLHGGFVGMGMLDAACPGAIFTSPTPDQIEKATKAVCGKQGALYIVKNYTGDILNFEMAAELARADGIEIETAVIDDDVAVKDSLYTAGRRGVGLTVLAEKITGAAAEAGMPLKDVAAICRKVNESGRSMGMALTSCTVPEAGRPTFQLAEDEMEIGIGIHGEPGRERLPIKAAKEIAVLLAEPILSDLPFKAGDSVLAFVNGMGGTPLLELYIIYHELAQILHKQNITVARSLVGPYITSLDMAGCSLTLLKMDEQLISLWDKPVKTAALRWGV